MTATIKPAKGPVLNIINHYVYVLDMSSSMAGLKRPLIQVTDELIQFLATTSKDMDQETRVTIYTFSDPDKIRCVVFDKDVLRTPSVAGFYNPNGSTALIDATLAAIDDSLQTMVKYGDHSFMLTVLTDGMNNTSVHTAEQLRQKFAALANNWTTAIFVPNQPCRQYAIRFGFPDDNIALWDATSEAGLRKGGSVMMAAASTYMTARATGAKSVRNLFHAQPVTSVQASKLLTPVTKGSYEVYDVGPTTQRVDDFAREKTGRYDLGHWYYQLVKPSKIQRTKQVAILDVDGNLYSGPEARRVLGLPDHDQQVIPASHGDVTIFVQSTAPNRNLLGGTKAIMMR